jgi:hypothetical protein
MSKLWDKIRDGLYQITSVPVPPEAKKAGDGAILHIGDSSKGITAKEGAVARPDICGEALKNAETTEPNAESKLWKLARDIFHRR